MSSRVTETTCIVDAVKRGVELPVSGSRAGNKAMLGSIE